MVIAVRNPSSWKYPKAAYANDGGTWKQAASVSVNDDGIWKKTIHIAAMTVGSSGGVNFGYLKSDHGSLSPALNAYGFELVRLEWTGSVMYIRYDGEAGSFASVTKTNWLKYFTVNGVTINTADAWDFQKTGDFLVEWRYLTDAFSLASKDGSIVSVQVTEANPLPSGIAVLGSSSLSWYGYYIYSGLVIYAGAKRGDTHTGTGNDYHYVRPSNPGLFEDSNAYHWQIIYWLEGPYAGYTQVLAFAPVAETYWHSMTWDPAPVTVVDRNSRSAFNAWNGTYTEWVFLGDVFDIFGHTTGIDTAFTIRA